MKKKTLCSLVAVIVLIVMAVSSAFAFAADARATNRCPLCDSSAALDFIKLNNDDYHRVYCGLCERFFYDGHTITDFAKKECFKCHDVIGD